MEIALIILVIGIAFWINQPSTSIDINKIKKLTRILDQEFQKRDDKIKELEDKIKYIENSKHRE